MAERRVPTKASKSAKAGGKEGNERRYEGSRVPGRAKKAPAEVQNEHKRRHHANNVRKGS